MNCWHCGTELIWGSDSNCENLEEYDYVTFLSCSNCGSDVEVYHPKPESKIP
jgi:transcription elongation factor Elf1